MTEVNVDCPKISHLQGIKEPQIIALKKKINKDSDTMAHTLGTSKELFQGWRCENIGGRSFEFDWRDVKLIFDESLKTD